MKIKKVLELSGLSQAEFARKIGMNTGLFSKVLSGKRKLSFNYAKKIAKTFDCSLDWLCSDE